MKFSKQVYLNKTASSIRIIYFGLIDTSILVTEWLNLVLVL